jgi:phytoene synthase
LTRGGAAGDAEVMADLAAELPPPQRLALNYASARARPAFLALLALDTRFAAVLRQRREPIAAQLRLAWWRKTLAEPAAGWPRGEPVLDALRTASPCWRMAGKRSSPSG